MEIERRYDIEGEIPKDKIKSQMYIEQLYSVIGDNKSIPDVRIRKIIQDNNEQYLHTVKYRTDDKNSRIEIEKPILVEEYNYIFQDNKWYVLDDSEDSKKLIELTQEYISENE